MEFQVENPPELQDVKIVTPDRFEDERGFFQETFRYDKFMEKGLPTQFVQDNHSKSVKQVLRGLHFQWSPPMGKLMRVTQGRAYLVAVDIRYNSPTLGQWFGMEVSDEDKKQIWAPAGFVCYLKLRKFNTSARVFTTKPGNRVSCGVILPLGLTGRYRTPSFRIRIKMPKPLTNG